MQREDVLSLRIITRLDIKGTHMNIAANLSERGRLLNIVAPLSTSEVE